MDLNQTIKKFRNGNNLAFQKLYDMYSGALMGVCLRFARNSDDAKDMLQEGFIKIYKFRKSFNPDLESGFYAWAKRIIINNNINYCKKNYKQIFSNVTTEIADPSTELEEQSKYKEELALCEAKLLNMIQDLPDGYRTVFNLYVFEGLTHKEIASYLNISDNTSKSQLSRARRILQNQINLLQQKRPVVKVS